RSDGSDSQPGAREAVEASGEASCHCITVRIRGGAPAASARRARVRGGRPCEPVRARAVQDAQREIGARGRIAEVADHRVDAGPAPGDVWVKSPGGAAELKIGLPAGGRRARRRSATADITGEREVVV